MSQDEHNGPTTDASLCPHINNSPKEVLSAILKEYMEEFDNFAIRSDNPKLPAAVHVCGLWRDLLITDPGNWREISLNFQRFGPSDSPCSVHDIKLALFHVRPRCDGVRLNQLIEPQSEDSEHTMRLDYNTSKEFDCRDWRYYALWSFSPR
jgi:hypothetical protein